MNLSHEISGEAALTYGALRAAARERPLPGGRVVVRQAGRRPDQEEIGDRQGRRIDWAWWKTFFGSQAAFTRWRRV